MKLTPRILLTVMVPVLATMAGGALLYGAARRAEHELQARAELISVAELTSELIDRKVEEQDRVLRTLLADEALLRPAPPADGAGGAWRHVQGTLERMREGLSDLQRVELYDRDGRLLAAAGETPHGESRPWARGELPPALAASFEGSGDLRVTRAAIAPGGELVAASLVVDYRRRLQEALTRATHHLDDLSLSVRGRDGRLRFAFGPDPAGRDKLSFELPLRPVEGSVTVEQPRDAALSSYERADDVLRSGMALVSAAIVLLVYFGLRWAVLSRLARIEAVVDAHDRGEPPPPLPAGPRDEIDRLGRLLESSLVARADQQLELRRLNAGLGERIAERTAELQELAVHLAEARDAAEEGARSKSRFLANMSHEIRTPMNGVIGMVELLLDSGLRDDQVDMARTVRSCGESLLHILNDILDYSKLEAGKVELERLPFDPLVLVEDVVELLAPQAHAARLEIGTFAEPGLPRAVLGDAGRLRQVLTNLLGNAVKFTVRGEVGVRLFLAGRDGGRVRLRLSVHDTGIGLDPEQRRNLFAAFSQADASTTRRFGGTGLGLAISRQLCQLMGSDIEVDSQPGKGSVFSLEVPLELVEPDAPPPDDAPLAGLRLGLACAEPRRRRHLMAQLATWGAAVVPLEERGAAAVLASEPCDGVVVDLDLPDDGGCRLLASLARDPGLFRTRRIALVSLTAVDGRQRALAAGAQHILRLPVRPSQFVRLLEESERADGGAAAASTHDAHGAESHDAATSGAQGGGPHDGAMRDADGGGPHGGATRDAECEGPHGTGAHGVAAPDEEPGAGGARAGDGRGARAAHGAAAPSRRRPGPDALAVLVAEDNLVNQRVTRAQLEHLGYRCDVVPSGRAAVAALEAGHYDLVLMDCQMPEMDGYEATRAIRALPGARARVPIVAMTANALRGDEQRCRDAGMDGYVSKPVRRDELGRTLAAVLARPAPSVPER